MKNILITGGAGFIGFHLAKYFAQKEIKVTVCDNFFRGQSDKEYDELLRKPNVRSINADLADKNQINKIDGDYDCVFHLAAVNGTKNFYKSPHTTLKVNLLSLINVLDWIGAKKIPRLVWTSSSETYAGTVKVMGGPVPTPETVPLSIEDIHNPRFSYAASKIAGESLCLGCAQAYGFKLGIVRPHNIYGPRMGFDHVMPEFSIRIKRRENPFKIHGGDQTRSFCYIDDFVRGIELVAQTDKTDREIFNIGNDKEEITMKKMALLLFDIAGFHPQIEILPPPEGSVDRRCPDIGKAREILGYEPRVNLKEGLANLYEWYRVHGES